ncbi:MAG: hypothetical protein M0P64_02455 [Candidatus Pacebacteria bacterium]|jgi:hypothetical protein|nr:hypothetical protein [Candidatus Paceibacterota bacterium]
MKSSQERNVVLDWDEALFRKCHSVEAEIHYKNAAYQGVVASIRKSACADNVLAVRLVSVVQTHELPLKDEAVEDRDFTLTECYRPLSLVDAEYDCLHINCKEGSADIYFKRPKKISE